MQEFICKNCGRESTAGRNTTATYCSNSCQTEFQYKSYVERWKAGLEDGRRGALSISSHIAKYLRIKYDGKCSECGWDKTNPTTGKCPLDIDHIDGNAYNNQEENLRLLCPNCHSLTPTFKNLNRGNGRKNRIKPK